MISGYGHNEKVTFFRFFSYSYPVFSHFSHFQYLQFPWKLPFSPAKQKSTLFPSNLSWLQSPSPRVLHCRSFFCPSLVNTELSVLYLTSHPTISPLILTQRPVCYFTKKNDAVRNSLVILCLPTKQSAFSTKLTKTSLFYFILFTLPLVSQIFLFH